MKYLPLILIFICISAIGNDKTEIYRDSINGIDIYKLKDGDVTCYINSFYVQKVSISCVRNK